MVLLTYKLLRLDYRVLSMQNKEEDIEKAREWIRRKQAL